MVKLIKMNGVKAIMDSNFYLSGRTRKENFLKKVPLDPSKTFLQFVYLIAVMVTQNLILGSFLREFEGTFFQKRSLIASHDKPQFIHRK